MISGSTSGEYIIQLAQGYGQGLRRFKLITIELQGHDNLDRFLRRPNLEILITVEHHT